MTEVRMTSLTFMIQISPLPLRERVGVRGSSLILIELIHCFLKPLSESCTNGILQPEQSLPTRTLLSSSW